MTMYYIYSKGKHDEWEIDHTTDLDEAKKIARAEDWRSHLNGQTCYTTELREIVDDDFGNYDTIDF